MKFTKLTSSVLAGATLLSILAPTASFAAIKEGNATANGGTALPMDGVHKTTAGISFGKTDPNGNTGFLRLQYVPYTLDFGNHMVYDDAFNTFDANGINIDKTDNTASAGYQGTAVTAQTNKTDTFNNSAKGLESLNTKKDAEGQVTNKNAWVTVVDKQQTVEKDDKGVSKVAGNDGVNGTWEVKVQSTDKLKGAKEVEGADVDAATGKHTPNGTGAILTLGNTTALQTQDVHTLTNEDQDATYDVNNAVGLGLATATKDITLPLDGTTTVSVAKADAGKGAGANVFAWNHDDIKLTMPKGATVDNGIYEAHLSWTLSTGVTK